MRFPHAERRVVCLVALRRLVPGLTAADLFSAVLAVRAQAMNRDGGLMAGVLFYSDRRAVRVLNARSPAAMASLEIAGESTGLAIKNSGLET
jgi:L-2-hydroxyglutarate oxidase